MLSMHSIFTNTLWIQNPLSEARLVFHPHPKFPTVLCRPFWAVQTKGRIKHTVYRSREDAGVSSQVVRQRAVTKRRQSESAPGWKASGCYSSWENSDTRGAATNWIFYYISLVLSPPKCPFCPLSNNIQHFVAWRIAFTAHCKYCENAGWKCVCERFIPLYWNAAIEEWQTLNIAAFKEGETR